MRQEQEMKRLAAVARYGLPDAPPDPVFDGIVSLAAQGLQAPMAAIVLVDESHVHFKASLGLSMRRMPRSPGLLDAELASGRPYLIADAAEHEVCRSHPLVTGETAVRFYAGCPLLLPEGDCIGMLCIMDTCPRQAEAETLGLLECLAALAVELMLACAERRQLKLREAQWQQRAAEDRAQLLRFAQESLCAEQALRESEERYHSLLELAADWYWEQDEQGRFIRITPVLSGKAGSYYGHYLGRTLRELAVHMSEADWRSYEAAMKSHGAFHELTCRIEDDAGQVRYVALSGRPIYGEAGRPRGYRGTAKDITEKCLSQNRLMTSYASLQQLNHALQDERDLERKHVARKLHEELAQMLAASRLELAAARRDLPSPSAQQPALDTLDQLLGSSMALLRRIVTELHPAGLEEGGLFYALQSLLRQCAEQEGVACSLIADEAELALDEALSTAVFRIVQAGLRDIVRRAQAETVLVKLNRHGGRLMLVLQHDGRGLPRDAPGRRNSLPLRELRERVRALRGRFRLVSLPKRGLRLEVALPLDTSSLRGRAAGMPSLLL